jgi:ferrochelatase
MEGKSLFLEGGGKSFNYIPALNKEDEWIKSMEEIIRPHLTGWIDHKWTQKRENNTSDVTKKMYNKVKVNLK